MPTRQISLQCAVDNEVTPHNQEMPNHVVHALVSLFLLGLWIPIWIIVAIGSGKDPATCVKCGNRRNPTGPATVSEKKANVGIAAEPVKPTSKAQILIMLVLMALVVIGLLIYDQMDTGQYNG